MILMFVRKIRRSFFKEINDALNNAKGDINFKVTKLRNREADEKYFYDIFVFKVEAYHNEDLIKVFIVDGKIVDNYDEIEKVKYQGPKIIDEDFYFYGVDLEYIAAEKIMALSCELTRPHKHLIDTYSLIKYGDLDVALLKEYLNEMLTYENKVRGILNIPLTSNDFKIKKDKSFIDDYYINAIQAGYRLSKEEMINEINNWIIRNIES